MRRTHTYYVYILTNPSRVLYVGVTNDLQRRVWEHKQGIFKGFTTKYGLKELVYFEAFGNIRAAIAREKQIKGWLRARKTKLISSANPSWKDLSAGWYPRS